MTKRYTMPTGGMIWSEAGGGEEKVVRRMADVGEVLSCCRETGVILGDKCARTGQPMQQCDCAPGECMRGKTAPVGLVTFAQIPLVRLDPAKVKSVGTADHGQRAKITMLDGTIIITEEQVWAVSEMILNAVRGRDGRSTA